MKNDESLKTKITAYLEKRIGECEAHNAKVIAIRMENGDDDFSVPYFEERIKVYNEILKIINDEG